MPSADDELWGFPMEAPEIDVPPRAQRPEIEPEWFRYFKTDQYDWDDPEWNQKVQSGKDAWRRIDLFMQRPGSTKRHDVIPSGYFMAVSPRDHNRLMKRSDGSSKRWKPRIDLDKYGKIQRIYARRCGRGDEPISVYAHREILGCIHAKTIGDHHNGWGLDNRRANLTGTNHSGNGHNTMRRRTKNTHLPVGVEPRPSKGGLRYGGIRAMRVKKGNKWGKKPGSVVIIRTKRTWTTPEPAARWYENQIKRLHGIRPWARDPKTLSYPLFPPRLETEPAIQACKRTTRVRAAQEMADAVPF